MLKTGNWRRWAAQTLSLILFLATIFSASANGKEATVEELKARLSDASIADRAGLCIQISELQLDAVDKLYLAGESEKGEAALVDVIAFSELARDYAIQSRKHEKQSEIAIRKMAHKLTDIKRTITFSDQKPIQDAIDRLQTIRDDLLSAMFPKGKKK
jgi:hypothetical protein